MVIWTLPSDIELPLVTCCGYGDDVIIGLKFTTGPTILSRPRVRYIDIPWASLGLLDACLLSMRSFLILGLTPQANLVPVSHEQGSLVGLAIPSTDIARDLIPARFRRALIANYLCEHLAFQQGP
ncbi:hypothetical protein PVK06_014338 [Gossypium arboreum]|uniref:Uncharacterized protein n=1 Tax=Gossypium arboreum TaxID=29729 RepID=A0ABR0PV21_GOSAR|nr:hypothetical protein PVK06_014338 [Gossypium arboreum]